MTRRFRHAALLLPLFVLLIVWVTASSALADGQPGFGHPLLPGDLLVSSTVYRNDPDLAVGTPLPPGCGTTPEQSSPKATASRIGGACNWQGLRSGVAGYDALLTAS